MTRLIAMFLLLLPVQCGVCDEHAGKVVLVHGFKADSTVAFLPWMRTRLEEKGYAVYAPNLPNPAHPDPDAWNEALTPYLAMLGPRDRVVAHSLGSAAVVRWLAQHADEVRVGHVILVASALGEYRHRDWERMRTTWIGDDIAALEAFWMTLADLHTIPVTTRITVVLSSDDPVVSLGVREFPEAWEILVWSGYGHFTKRVIPALLEVVCDNAEG